MNFENKILQTVTEKLKLRRMRFKVDPAIANLEDFDGDISYEGYVLNENNGVVTILVIDPNNGVRQTHAVAQSLNVLSPDLNAFKTNIIQTLINSVPEQVLMQIRNAATFDEVEQLARQNGATDEQVESAHQSPKNESTLNEQGFLRSLRRTIGKAGDVAKEVAFGKDAKTLGQKAIGAANIMGRVGETLKKFGPQGSGKFEFKERSSVYHKDKPRAGQTVSIDYKSDDGKRHIITGKVGAFETASGGKSFIRLKNVVADPEIPEMANIGDILVDFRIDQPGAEFFVYDKNNQKIDNFSGKIGYDASSKSWSADNTGKQKDVKQDTDAEKQLRDLESKYGSEPFQEQGGKKRKLYKIKGQDVYFDSNYNRQKPQMS